MALPDRLPEPPDDFESHSASADRPNWLVGAEEGAVSEMEGLERTAGVKLTRPKLSEVPHPANTPPAAAATPATPRPVAWTAAGNSVPRLTQVPEPARRTPEPPVEDLDAVADPLSDPDPVAGMRAPASSPARPAFTNTLEEPWWLVLGERLGSDRRLQMVLGAALVLLLAFVFWPRGGHGMAVRELRRHPDKWEGQTVSVNGRVGEVFPLGSGYVFNLYQGRDTIVVFTRSRHPSERAHIQVTGEVSAGYLDGRARLAILESPTPQNP